MGGSIACKTTIQALENEKLSKRIVGMIIIDVVEGTAMDALPFMESIIQ